MLRWIKRILIVLLALVAGIAAGIVLFVGPWPLYTDSHYRDSTYFTRALAEIDKAAASANKGNATSLQAGWAERDITPEIGHPLAGYGGRANDKRSEGIREPVFVRALALHDGRDTVVLVGTDLLQTLPNILELVEKRIQPAVGLTNANIMYTSSHTHCGPGGLAPGIVAREAFGDFSPAYLDLLSTRIAEAIIAAVQDLAPARFAHTAIDAPEYIRNRTRSGNPVDSLLHVAVAEKLDTRERIHIARYSAHGTAYGEEVMTINNDFAGAFQRAVRESTGGPLLYMGGAVGSMRPYPPGPPMPAPWTPELERGFENDIESAEVRTGRKTLATLLRDQEARVEAMGAALTKKLIEAEKNLSFSDHIDLASMHAFYTPPPAQARMLSPNWRMSPFLFRLLGVPTTGRLQAARIGDLMLIGMPYDMGGETSVKWQAWAKERQATLWVTSFSGAYLGYLSPDQNYYDIGDGHRYNENYEIGEMGWFGPNQEAYVTDLFQHTFDKVMPQP